MQNCKNKDKYNWKGQSSILLFTGFQQHYYTQEQSVTGGGNVKLLHLFTIC